MKVCVLLTFDHQRGHGWGRPSGLWFVVVGTDGVGRRVCGLWFVLCSLGPTGTKTIGAIPIIHRRNFIFNYLGPRELIELI